MTSVRIHIDKPAVREAALTSPEIRAGLRLVAEQVAARAENIEASTGVTSEPSEIKVTEGGVRRARFYVTAEGPQAAAREAKYRILGRSLPGGQ